MTAPTSFELSTEGQVLHVAVRGDLTEHSDFAAVLKRPEPELVFDLRGVRRINSCGVREWIRFVEALRGSGRRFELEHCSVSIVNQMNMIVNFTAGVRVRSFYAPYLCPQCDQESLGLFDIDPSTAPAVPTTRPCPHCAATAEFDDIPEMYLAFARA